MPSKPLACSHQSPLLQLPPLACRASLGLQQQVKSAVHGWLQTFIQLPLPYPQDHTLALSIRCYKDIALRPAVMEYGCRICDCFWQGLLHNAQASQAV